jgi:hypothetical protein
MLCRAMLSELVVTSLLRLPRPSIGRTLKGIESVFRKGQEERRDVPVSNLSIVGTLSR